MAIDAKGIWDEHWKLILSLLGLILVVLLMGNVEGGLVNGPFTTITPQTNNQNSVGGDNNGAEANSIPDPVNNGKNGLYSSAPVNILENDVDYKATVVTNRGTFTIDLFENQTPRTVNSFVFLSSASFYDGTSFHRVIERALIQGGDPVGNGTGGPGYSISDEIVSDLRFEPYVVAMANSGPNLNGSQFFITTGSSASNINSYNGQYTIFGKVIEGFDVVDEIAQVEVSQENDHRPLDPVIINSINIIEN